MKIKKILTTLILLLCINSLNISSFAKTSAKTSDDQQTLEKFFRQTPLQVSTYSIKYFFKNSYSTLYDLTQYRSVKNTKTVLFNKSMSEYIRTIFNLDEYPEYISQNGIPIIEYLELCNELNIDTERVYSGLRLFYNKLKGCELIDDTVVNQLLSKTPNLLAPYFDTTEKKASPFVSLSYNIERLLYSKFTQDIDLFQQAPDIFLTDLSDAISSLTQNTFNKIEESKNEKEILQRLRQTTIKTFELLINKTIWDYQQYERIWYSVLSIANGCENLAANQIITHIDDLDELLWSLIERFCFFLDFAGAALPVSFYEIIENDLESKVVFFLEESELDEGIKTKKERLIKSLISAKAKAIAAERGILADSTII
ncbi:MAG: hypothetical protein ABIA74_05785 [bacterium]